MSDMHVVLIVPPHVAEKISAGVLYAFTDLSSTSPKLRIDGRCYDGHYEDVLGTDLAFDPNETSGQISGQMSHRDPKQDLSQEKAPSHAGLVATSTKRLVFSESTSAD
jgi:TFIIIC subunit triple barrel domain